jgi:hypothetical protein
MFYNDRGHYIYTRTRIRQQKKNYWGSQKSWDITWHMVIAPLAAAFGPRALYMISQTSERLFDFWRYSGGLMERGGLPCI